ADPLADHADDTPMHRDLKRRAREKRDNPAPGDARVITDPRTGQRHVASIPYAVPPDRDNDPPEHFGNEREDLAPQARPVPVPPPARRAEPARVPDDPSKVRGIDPSGRPTYAMGAKVV